MGCSKVGENCMSTKCCKTTGYMYFTKDAGMAKCMMECDPAKDGWCTQLVNTKPVHTLGMRLFCWSFYTKDTGDPDTTNQPDELALLRTQLSLGASIFGCPKWAVFSDVQEMLSPGPPTPLSTIKVEDVDGDFHLFKRKKTGCWVNAMMHYQAWKTMRDKNMYSDSDWVIKSDVDAVFLPIRLLKTLNGYKVPAGGVYVENCKKVMYGFFGNLEVVSVDAFKSFASNLESCKGSLDWKGTDPGWKFGPYGEDLFMQKCMDKIGVPKVSNFTIVSDGMCKYDVEYLGTYLKKGKYTYSPTCDDAKTVSYHPLKKPADYFTCLAKTQKIAGETR